jgi:hypothetical protein
MNKIKCELEKKILEEQSLKENAESKLITLEQEEIEIMKRIRTTTQVHKASIINILFIMKIYEFYFEKFFISFSG